MSTLPNIAAVILRLEGQVSDLRLELKDADRAVSTMRQELAEAQRRIEKLEAAQSPYSHTEVDRMITSTYCERCGNGTYGIRKLFDLSGYLLLSGVYCSDECITQTDKRRRRLLALLPNNKPTP